MEIKKTQPNIDTCTYIARKGFGIDMSREEVAEHINPYDVYGVGNPLRGFAAFSMLEENLAYLAGIVLLPEAQGRWRLWQRS